MDNWNKINFGLLRDVSQWHIQHCLAINLKLSSCLPAKKHLTKNRLAFVWRYETWTEDDLKKVMWNNESTYRCITEHQGRVRRPLGASRYKEYLTVKTVKQPPSLMVLGCCSGEYECGALHILSKNVTVNSDIYVKVLCNHMLAYIYEHRCTFHAWLCSTP